MSDLQLVPDGLGEWDINFDGTDLVLTDDLENSILISLETMAQAEESENLPDGSDDRRGFWADDYSEEPDDKTGSKTWLLSREKITSQLLNSLRQTTEQCLEWMKRDGVARTVTVVTERYSDDIVAIYISITRPTGVDVSYKYYYNWEAQLTGRTLNEVT